jgi:hypothetical protein
MRLIYRGFLPAVLGLARAVGRSSRAGSRGAIEGTSPGPKAVPRLLSRGVEGEPGVEMTVGRPSPELALAACRCQEEQEAQGVMTDRPDYEFSFAVSPPYSIERRDGDVWVVGDGVELPCDLRSAVSLIAGQMEDPETALTNYLMN